MPTEWGMSMYTTEKGEVCELGYLSESVSQTMHFPAEDVLLLLMSLRKTSRRFSETLQPLPSRAPAKMAFFCFPSTTYNPPSLHPSCSFAWSPLPPDCHTAVPSPP